MKLGIIQIPHPPADFARGGKDVSISGNVKVLASRGAAPPFPVRNASGESLFRGITASQSICVNYDKCLMPIHIIENSIVPGNRKEVWCRMRGMVDLPDLC